MGSRTTRRFLVVLVAAATLASSATACRGQIDVGSAFEDSRFHKDAASPSPGPCSLDVIGAGPFDISSDSDHTQYGDPVAAVSNDGFVFGAIRASDNTVDVKTMKVTQHGAPVPASENTTLPFNRYSWSDGCSSTSPPRMGIDFSANTGLLVFTAGHCPGTPTRILGVSENGHLQDNTGAPLPVAPSVTSESLSARPLSRGYVVRVIDGRAMLQAVSVRGSSGDPQPIGGAGPHRAAWIAGSDEGLAVLTLGAAEAGRPELTLQVSTVTGPSFEDAPPLTGNMAAVAIAGRRVALVSDSETLDSLTLRTIQIGDPVYVTVPEEPDSLGVVRGVDVAIANNRVHVAHLHSGGISVRVYDRFDTTPHLLSHHSFASSGGVSEFFRGVFFPDMSVGSVSIAAKDDTVAIAWRGSAAGDLPSGWAVLSCR